MPIGQPPKFHGIRDILRDLLASLRRQSGLDRFELSGHLAGGEAFAELGQPVAAYIPGDPVGAIV
jgi:hypothetical protein